MSKPQMERRFLKGLELREDKAQDGRIATLVGYAALFNSLSEDLGGFRELIRPGAFKESLARGDDVRALVGHDSTMVIGRRSAKTLAISEDDRGLRVEIAVPDTTVGRDLVVSMKRGDITGQSFGFSTVKDEWSRQSKDGDIVYRRELVQVDLFEVSAVAWPAYTDTSVEARQLGDVKVIFEAARRRLATDGQGRRDRITRQYRERMKLWN